MPLFGDHNFPLPEDKEESQSENWWDHPPQDIESCLQILERRAVKLQSIDDEGIALRSLLQKVEEAYNQTLQDIKALHPIAFVQPSYEQSLLLNCWWCGIDFPVCFSANRIGKTAAFTINAILWLFPNNPEWLLFSAATFPPTKHQIDQKLPATPNPDAPRRLYRDHLGRPVQILPRPSILELENIRFTLSARPELRGDPTKSHLDPENAEKFATLQSLIPTSFQSRWPRPPIHEGGTLWLGAPDLGFHRDIIMKEWRRWLPQESIMKWSDSDQTFLLSTNSTTNPSPTIWSVLCKSYESDDTKWSGSAVTAIVLTEGLTLATLSEVRQRIKVNGFASWDYTPYEARNVGSKTALAFQVYQGKESLPLTSYIFTNFSARNAPNHILPEEKRKDLIRMWDGSKEGEARLDGNFYSTSPQILSRLDKPFHMLDWTLEEFQENFPSAQYYRGLDPGYDHPTVCAFAAIVPGNKWFIYQYYIKRQTTIQQRCSDIITLSGNERAKHYWGKREGDFVWRETHPHPKSIPFILTAADFHMFKADEVSGKNYANNYIQEGLILAESTHMRPEDRALEIDKLLEKQKHHVHPIFKTTPGAQIYFLTAGLNVDFAIGKMEALFWERLHSGPNKGLEKDTVPSHGDDELDATCYIVCGPYRWNAYSPRKYQEVEREDDKVLMSV
jgi:hypothetical protein